MLSLRRKVDKRMLPFLMDLRKMLTLTTAQLSVACRKDYTCDENVQKKKVMKSPWKLSSYDLVGLPLTKNKQNKIEQKLKPKRHPPPQHRLLIMIQKTTFLPKMENQKQMSTKRSPQRQKSNAEAVLTKLTVSNKFSWMME